MSASPSDASSLEARDLLALETDPAALERRYRDTPRAFEAAFDDAFQMRPDSPVFQAWRARLSYAPPADRFLPPAPDEVDTSRLWVVIGLVLIAGTLAKLPDLVGLLGGVLPEDRYYMRNTGFFVLPFVAAYFLHVLARPPRFIGAVAVLVAVSCLYINLLPGGPSDTVLLASIHLPFWLWGLLGLAYVGTYRKAPERRLQFLRFNGEMLVYTALILIAGGLLSALTMALFALIDLDIAEVYMENVGVYGLAGAPIVATLLATTRYGVAQRIAPVIARLFGPLALVALVVYLGAFLTRAASPFEDREMLAILNLVLIAVLALIVFTVLEYRQHAPRLMQIVGAGLLGVAVVLDLIALSAIVTRLLGGLTPNRVAVLGANLLILVHLVILLYRYVRLLAGRGTLDGLAQAVTWYLPLYVGWAALVTFGFPLLFAFA